MDGRHPDGVARLGEQHAEVALVAVGMDDIGLLGAEDFREAAGKPERQAAARLDPDPADPARLKPLDEVRSSRARGPFRHAHCDGLDAALDEARQRAEDIALQTVAGRPRSEQMEYLHAPPLAPGAER